MSAPPRRPKTSLRFTRLRLVNWRNFRSVDLQLGPRAFIVGPNASGKSNLLDALRFVAELAQPGSGGLRAAVDSRGGFGSVRSLFARNPSHVEIAVAAGDDVIPDRWTYELQLNFRRLEKLPTVLHEVVRHHPGGDAAEQVIAIRDRPKQGDALEFSQTLLEQVGQSKDFRELQEFLASSRYLHVVPQMVRERTRARLDGNDPFGGDLLRRMNEMPPKSRDARLRRIARGLQIAVPQFDALELMTDSEGVPHLLASYRHWRLKASKQSEASFSDGTLRLIGLLWSMSERGGPLLLEEPELSLNDAVISQLPPMLGRMQSLSSRQVILTTHSTALLEEVSVGEVFLIEVGANGSEIIALDQDREAVAQVGGGMTVGQVVLPRVQPEGIENLASSPFGMGSNDPLLLGAPALPTC